MQPHQQGATTIPPINSIMGTNNITTRVIDEQTRDYDPPVRETSSLPAPASDGSFPQAEMADATDAIQDRLQSGKHSPDDIPSSQKFALHSDSMETPGTTTNGVAKIETNEDQLIEDDESRTNGTLLSQSAPADGPTDGGLPVELDAPKKKRKNRPGKTRRAITGFEKFYADTPTTPAEHADEKKMYATDAPFALRIELAIQRYRQKRRFDSQRSFLFDKYLALGGIDSSQRMFQGFDPAEAKDMTSDEIREMTARDVIHCGVSSSKFYDPDTPGAWTVNFPMIVRGFLSRWVPENYPRSDQGSQYDNEQAADLLHNFLSYLQMHDVCPEYNSQILAAKAICGMAPSELMQARELFCELQDSFNSAAKFLFCEGGVFEANAPSPVDGTVKLQECGEFPGQDPAMRTKKLDPFTQLVIFRLTVMDVNKDTKHLATDDDPRSIHVVSTEIDTYQVISVHRRKKKEKALLEKLLVEQGLGGQVKPAGTMMLRRSMIEHAYSNLPRVDRVDFSQDTTEKFIVNDDVLAKVQPGMKMQLELCKLNIGVVFIKKVLDVRVDFDTLLPQGLMLTWKDPVENDRSAPSVDNPGLDDKAIGGNGCDM